MFSSSGLLPWPAIAAIEILGKAWDAGWRLTVRCAFGRRDGLKSIRECHERIDIDMRTLIWTRGRACTLAALGERFRCPKCGSRRVSVMFTPPANSNAVRVGLRR